MSNFYGTEIKIWDGFGPFGNTDWAAFEGDFFMFSRAEKKLFTDIVASALDVAYMNDTKRQFFFLKKITMNSK